MNDDTFLLKFFASITIFFIIALLGTIPANIAYKKGRSFFSYWFVSIFFFLPTLIVALLIGPDHQALEKRKLKNHD